MVFLERTDGLTAFAAASEQPVGVTGTMNLLLQRVERVYAGTVTVMVSVTVLSVS